MVLYDHGADIVPRASRQRVLDQPIGGVHHGTASQYTGDFGVGDGAVEPVGAEQQNIACLKTVASFFEDQRVGRPYQICHDIPERMCCRSFRCDLAAVDQVLDMALITAQLKQPAGAHPIETTIPSPQAAALVFEESARLSLTYSTRGGPDGLGWSSLSAAMMRLLA